MTDWISTKERLPSLDGKEFRFIVCCLRRDYFGGSKPRVLVTEAGYGPRLAQRQSEGETKWENHFYELGMLVPSDCWIPDEDITHWMPMPEPPK